MKREDPRADPRAVKRDDPVGAAIRFDVPPLRLYLARGRSLGAKFNGGRRPTTGASEAALGPLRQVFRAVVCTVVPEGADLDDAGWSELEALVQESLRARPHALQQRFRLFLRLVQWLPMFRYGRRFTSLDPTRRARWLSYLQDHRIGVIRVGFWGLRTLALLGYYGRAAAAEAIGYRPDPKGWDA